MKYLVAILLILFSNAVFAQHEDHSMHSSIGWVPAELLTRPVAVRSGIGVINDPVTTSSKDAQAFFNQGVAYLHSYVWVEASRSFHQALRYDPNLAMAYVGLSRAYSGLEDSKAAQEAALKAQQLSSRTSDRERKRIALRLEQLDAMSDPANAEKLASYRKEIDESLARFPDDLELWLLRGNAEESTAAGRGQRGGEATIQFYNHVLERQPDHFAAHHYLIHSCEGIGNIEQALKHGEAYARLAPAIPHAQHMYGHDLRRVGRIQEAIARFRKTDELETAYYASEKIKPEYDWHHVHNLGLLATSFQHQGQMKEAERLLKEAFVIPRFTEYYETWGAEWPEFLLNRARNQEALQAARELTARSKFAAARSIGHVLAGTALLRMNRTSESQAELEAAKRELPSVGVPGPLAVKQATIQTYIDTLEGEMLLRQGKQDEGTALLKEVQANVRSIPGPDAWIQGLFKLQSIARLAREVGNWELAQYTATQMMEHDSAYGGSLFELALVDEYQANQSNALMNFKKAQEFWKNGDNDLPELIQIRAKLNGKQ
jgi:tetratricopeptide (TPR) repeat protein